MRVAAFELLRRFPRGALPGLTTAASVVHLVHWALSQMTPGTVPGGQRGRRLDEIGTPKKAEWSLYSVNKTLLDSTYIV